MSEVQDGEKEHWYKPPAIDPSGTLPNGKSFKSFEDYRAELLTQSDRFLKGLAEKMFMYALGRTLEASDRTTIDSLVKKMKTNGHSLRALIHGIVESEAFQTK